MELTDFDKYHKIEGPFRRYVEGPQKNTLIPWDWTRDEFAFLQNVVPWRFTEKVDGTNVRILWDGHTPRFAGRTDRAQMPTKLIGALQDMFTEELLEQVFGETPAILYGEGFGAGIQKGGIYRPDQSFILFDVKIHGCWLTYENVEDISNKLGIAVVPTVFIATLNQAIRHMSKEVLYSRVAVGGLTENAKMEGVVGTPLTPLLNRVGGRIIVKLKTADLYQLDLNPHNSLVPKDLPVAA